MIFWITLISILLVFPFYLKFGIYLFKEYVLEGDYNRNPDKMQQTALIALGAIWPIYIIPLILAKIMSKVFDWLC